MGAEPHPVHKWLMAFYLLSSSKKGISSHQLMRRLFLVAPDRCYGGVSVEDAPPACKMTAPG
jgi:hypothetical protein